jgi:hypothetical protein
MFEEPANADELSNEIHALGSSFFPVNSLSSKKDRLEQLVFNDKRACDLCGKCIFDSVGIRTHFANSILDGMGILHNISRKRTNDRRSTISGFLGDALRSVGGFVSDNTPLRSILHLKTNP